MSLPVALQQIEFARGYTLSLLNDIDEADWYGLPAGCPTHLAWQIGHLAMAEYGLCLFRQRGRAEIDREIMPGDFRKAFSRGSQPETEASKFLPRAEIRAIFDRVHSQVLKEAPSFTAEQLKETVEAPYAVEATKLGSLYFCSHHEMLHAGQIGLVRRLLGKPPVR
jgi:hypothetical protein